MDSTQRHITKIAREVSRFTVRTMREDGIGTAEFDFLHAVRKNPGITQAGIREILNLDKGAAARRAASLEAKGYIRREENPEDQRSRLLFANEEAEELKNSKASIEAGFYEWLTEEFSEEEKDTFSALLDRLYRRCKTESRQGFVHVAQYLKEKQE